MYENCVAGAAARKALEPMNILSTSPERGIPEVSRAIDDLRNVVERFDNLVYRLVDRLVCVTSSSPPMGEPQQKEDGYQTGLASAIDEERRKLRDITNILESLYERIELGKESDAYDTLTT